MKVLCITIENNKTSLKGYETLVKSSAKFQNDFDIEIHKAITPEIVDDKLSEFQIEWNYPWNREIYDSSLGLLKTPYATKNKRAKIACALSHYSLWKYCEDCSQPVLILEHDAEFIKKLDFEYLLESKYEIIGLNSPIGATRKSSLFDKIIKSNPNRLQPIPKIDKDKIPQGLAGASAYLLKPYGAKKILDKVKEVGLWHNDALLCRQLFGSMMAVTKTYYTRVQKGLESTTR